MLRHSLAVTTIAVVQFLPLSSRANAETIQCGAGDVQCLISAINQANVDPHNTTIHLAGGIYALTSLNNVANGPNGLPTITSPVTVEAGKDGATLARVEGAPGFRILRVGGSGRLTLEGITLAGGDATTFVPGDLLTISGGAILNAGGVVTASNTVFDGNSSEEFGGAIFSNNGNLSIDNSTFSGNVSSFGGGLSIRGGSVKITRTTFDNNYAPGAAGGVWTENATTYISQSRFEENGGGHAVGGVLVRGGTASINESTFKRNVSDPAGALWADSQALVTVLNSAFVENRGAGGGSGILNAANVNVINTTFARNVGGSISFLGIAILNVGTMTLINTTFAENTTYGGNGPGTQPASVISSGPTATTALQNTILVHNTQDL